MTSMRFLVADVGQGSCNLVELLDAKGAMIGAALLDIGSLGDHDVRGVPSAEFVIAELTKMASGPRKKIVLDAVVLSHPDGDHVNLIKDVLAGFDTPHETAPTKPVLTIEGIWYGGLYRQFTKRRKKDQDYPKNILKYLDTFTPSAQYSAINELEENSSSFDGAVPATGREPLAYVGDASLPAAERIKLWALAANTAAPTPTTKNKNKKRPRGAAGYALNSVSVIIAAEFAGDTLIATGDATCLTFNHCNTVMASSPDAQAKLLYSGTITIPHHGATATLYNLTGVDGDARDVIKKFVDNIQPRTHVTSAGRRSYCHPRPDVLLDFGTHLQADIYYVDPALAKRKSDQHFYTAYLNSNTFALGGVEDNWPKTSGWHGVRTNKNIFTTDYMQLRSSTELVYIAFPWKATRPAQFTIAPIPPRGISWAFDLDNTGDLTLKVAREYRAMSPAYRALVEEVHGEPLPRDERFVWVRSAPPPDPPPPPAPAWPLEIAPPPPPLGMGRIRPVP